MTAKPSTPIAAATAAESLDSARALIEVKHKMEEIELSALLLIFKYPLCEVLVFLENCGEFLLGKRIFFL